MRGTSTASRWAQGCALAAVCAALRVFAQTAPPLPLRPSSLAFDAAGDLFFTDAGRHQVYEVSLAGVVTVIAGTGVQGFSGDGSAATAAQLNEPRGIAVGADGTVYVADSGNHRVRAIQAGVIHTLAGQGSAGYGGDGGAATSALLNRPWGLALGPDGSLWIADYANQRVRVVRSGVIGTVAGTGKQGFAGDGGLATQAELNGPIQLALAGDGSLILSDSGNARVRSVSPAGVIGTLVGSAVEGFAGDGGPALQARLSRPQGLGVTALGEVYIADSGNQRVRVLGADRTVRTVAGVGLQGSSAEGSASTLAGLDGPQGIAVSPLGLVWFADARNATVRAVTSDGRLFQPAGLVPRSTAILAQTAPDASGQTLLSVNLAGQAGVAQGSLSVGEGGTTLATATVSQGTASLSLGALSSGTHTLTVRYSGDTLNPAGSTTVTSVVVPPGTVVATANAATMDFGGDLPAFTGTLAGVTAQDAGLVSVSFTTAANPLSPVGVYPITAALTGPAANKYALQLSPGSGQFVITPATSTTAMLMPAPAGYEGLPLALSANVTAAAKGIPTGSLMFVENGVTLAVATLVNGSATAVLPKPSVGQHAVVARYAGDANFLPSDSAAQTVAVNTLPDFTVSQLAATAPTMNPGTSASFSFQVNAAPAPFTGAVAFAATGLPSGWTARFAPSSVIPGSGSATVVLTVTASGTAEWKKPSAHGLVFALLCLPLMVFRRGRHGARVFRAATLLGGIWVLCGCGDRVASTADIVPPHPASFTVTGTATNLAGQTITHAVVVGYMQP